MAPVVAEVEGEAELLSEVQLPGHLQRRLVLPAQIGSEIIAGKADPATVGELEVMKMREIPAAEGPIDRIGELAEAMGRTADEDPARGRVEVLPSTAEKVDPDLNPRPRHAAERLSRVLRQLLSPAGAHGPRRWMIRQITVATASGSGDRTLPARMAKARTPSRT